MAHIDYGLRAAALVIGTGGRRKGIHLGARVCKHYASEPEHMCGVFVRRILLATLGSSHMGMPEMVKCSTMLLNYGLSNNWPKVLSEWESSTPCAYNMCAQCIKWSDVSSIELIQCECGLWSCAICVCV